jgi:hypothetical protein
LLPVRVSVPTPALLSVPVPEISAARVTPSVKSATMAPSLRMVGVISVPPSPPVPSRSMLPARILVSAASTTPPLLMASVPTRGPQPQPPSPMESPTVAVRREPGPVTSTKDEPSTLSPMKATLVLTTPPSAIVSRPIPPVVPPPTERPKPPIFHCDPGPVTLTVEAPKKESTSAPPSLLSTPPLLMVSAPVPKTPTPVKPPAATVTVDPGPEIVMLEATSRSPKKPLVGPTCSVPPLITESVPPSTVTPWAKPLTVSEPPSIVSEPVEQRHRSRSPPITLPVPVNRNEAASSSSMEPGPVMTPE